MASRDEITYLTIKNIQEAIHEASHDYFLWSGGKIIYECGVESLMQVYAAKRLFQCFIPKHKIKLRLEHSRKELVQDLGGRIDLTLKFEEGVLFAIEFKRYSNRAMISKDLARLREIMVLDDTVGLLAAPCYVNDHETNYDWPYVQKQGHEAKNPKEIWHLSDLQKLPEPTHPGGWTHERALVIEVVHDLAII